MGHPRLEWQVERQRERIITEGTEIGTRRAQRRERRQETGGVKEELGVFGFGREQDGDVGVGVFPEGEEILVGGAGFGVVSLEGIGTGQVELGHGVETADDVEPAMIENFLEFHGGFRAIVHLEVGAAAGVHYPINGGAGSQFIFFRGLQNGDGLSRFVLVNQVESPDRGSNGIFEDGVIRIFFNVGVQNFLRLSDIANERERKRDGTAFKTINIHGQRFGGLFARAIGEAV